jgi:hypothetical protein
MGTDMTDSHGCMGDVKSRRGVDDVGFPNFIILSLSVPTAFLHKTTGGIAKPNFSFCA